MTFKFLTSAFGARSSGVTPSAKLRGQGGSTLIEVLVSVVLLSFGIVGLAGLQMNGTKFNHDSYLRSQGVALAYDLADRVRANLCANNQVCVAYITGQNDLFDGTAAQRCGLALGDQGTSDAMAVVDVNQWKNCLEDRLPEGRGIVTLLPAGAGAAYTDQCNVDHARADVELLLVEVNWADGRTLGGGARDCVVMRTEVRPL